MLENKGNDSNIIITDSTDLRSDLSFDSLDLAELTVRVEKDFGIDIYADGIVTTVAEIKAKLKI
jgi:acyl carrier protein